VFFLSPRCSLLPSFPPSLLPSLSLFLCSTSLFTSSDGRGKSEGGREEGRKEGREGGAYLHCRVSRVEPVEQLLVSEHDKGLEKILVEGIDARPNAWRMEGAREGGREGRSGGGKVGGFSSVGISSNEVSEEGREGKEGGGRGR